MRQDISFPRVAAYIKVRDCELQALEACRSIVEWNRVYDAMMLSRGHRQPYPSVDQLRGWQERVIDSGLLDRKLALWVEARDKGDQA